MARSSTTRRRTLEQKEKDARALALYCQGKHYQQIADMLGWKSASTALQAVKRAIADRQKDAFGQTEDFVLAVARIQRTIAYHEGVIAQTHYVVASATGKVARDEETGEKLIDPAPGQRSAAALERLFDQLNKLQGTYAPTKSRQEIVPEDVVDQEIARLAKKLAEKGKNTEVPSE